MKIAIAGYSGSGKSTLARKLAEKYGVEAFHFDAVQFLPGWEVRPGEEKARITEDFLNAHSESGWVMDGNYTKLSYERRMEEADLIVLMLFGRFDCLYRAFRRYLAYRGKTRPDMAEGCNEKFDWEFIRWILWEGRSKSARKRYQDLARRYPGKCVILRNQRALDRFKREKNI